MYDSIVSLYKIIICSINRKCPIVLQATWVLYYIYYQYTIYHIPTGQGDQGSPTLQDVMVFLTWCDCVPPLGFGDVKPGIMFTDDAVLPTVSTCSLTLHFPRSFPTDFQQFKEKMDFVILGSQGFFGTV